MANSDHADEAMRHPRVVIIGAGFGGLSAAKALAGKQFDVTLIEASANSRDATNWRCAGASWRQRRLQYVRDRQRRKGGPFDATQAH
jgi:cation diffusion facilitator CzcD-associated flavoprotein CzcO